MQYSPARSRSAAHAAIVLTTVSDSEFLDAYFANLTKFGWLERATVFLIPDRKTPNSVRERCAAINRLGLQVRCPTLEDQVAFLKRVGLPPSMIPYDSDNRRNVGFLMALDAGADFLVSVDDDNFCRDEDDFLGEHAVVTEPTWSDCVASSPTGFLNICELLEFDQPLTVYPRGFPYYARHQDEAFTWTLGSQAIHCNAGLWLLDPDVDGITWLVANPRVRGFKGRSIVLDRDTWSPINSQNTALRREAIPAYYFIRMGYPLAGLPIDRYGDIFSGYFLEACLKHLKGGLRVGTPIADHRRNAHQHIKDATREWACILALEDLLPWLRGASLDGNSYLEAYLCLSHMLEDAVEAFHGSIWTDVTRGYFHQMGYSMRQWEKACRTILGEGCV